MSTYFEVWCESCEELGPKIRRGAGTVVLQASVPDEDSSTGSRWGTYEENQAVWARFLIDHEWHRLQLRHE